MNKNSIFLILVLALALSCIQCAEKRKQFANNGRPELLEMLNNGRLDYLDSYVCSVDQKCLGSDYLCTSFLPSDSGVIPEKSMYNNDFLYNEAVIKYSSTYSSYRLNDNDLKTAWVEGVEGDGINEVVFCQRIDLKKPVKIWAGIGTSKELFVENNRPKKVRVYVLYSNKNEKQNFPNRNNAFCPVFKDVEVIAKLDVELKDYFGYQPLQLPDYNKNEIEDFNEPCASRTSHYLAIQILSVYKGTKYSDTAITEIDNE